MTLEKLIQESQACKSWDWDQAVFLEWLKKYEPAMKGGLKILSVGACGDIFSEWLTELGNEVTGVDWRPYTVNQWEGNYNLKEPTFHFIQADFNTVDLPREYFDMALACSSIEHFGLGRWTDPKGTDMDVKAARTVQASLKPGGLFLVSVPYGHDGVAGTAHRFYSAKGLQERLLGPLQIIDHVEGQDFGGTIFVVAKKP